MQDHQGRQPGGVKSCLARVRGCGRIAIVGLLSSWLAIGSVSGQDLDLGRLGTVARAQINALIAEKQSRTPAQRKIDSRLLRTIDAQRPSPRFPLLHSLSRPQPDKVDRLIVDIDLFDGERIQDVLGGLKSVRAQVLFASPRFRSIRARVGVRDLEAIAAIPNVRFIANKREFRTNKETTSQGDATHVAAQVRSTLGYTGNGQKLCVVSDGVDTLAARQASGDLPAVVDVLPGQAGFGDEGTAMLEILYDLAPGARLGFATANGGEAAFAQNVLDLANPAKGGCTIIVDDILYLIESPFQDGIEAQAVNAATAAGVLYFSAAANSGNLDQGWTGTWEGDFHDAGAITDPLFPGQTLHEFAPGVPQNVLTEFANIAVMHWAEPFGAAVTDYDLYVLDADMTTVLASSTDTQDGTQDPVEGIEGFFEPGSRLVVAKTTGAANRMLNLTLFQVGLSIATGGATRGHSAAANAFSVAATPAAEAIDGFPTPAGPYPNPFNLANEVEFFSSDGPRRIFFDGAGNLLPGAPPGNFTASGGVVRNKPDITAADGVAVSAPGFDPFFGTSAAVTHAAAIGALVKQAFPAWTMAQLRTGLAAGAIDIHGAGWDRNSGVGIVMPLATLQANAAPAIAGLSLVTVTPTEVNGNGDGLIDSGEDWKLDIVLGNTGGVTGTGIVATLASSTAGVVVTSGSASYPSLGVNATAANPVATPFRFSVFDVQCGQILKFTLTVMTAQSPNPQVFAFEIPSVLVLGAPQTFSYTSPSVAIPDALGAEVPGPTVAASLAVSGVPAPIGDLKLRIDGLNDCTPNTAANAGIDHTWVGDLVIGLEAPDGTMVQAINRMGFGFTDGPNLCDTTLEDQSTDIPIGGATSDLAPFVGSFKPDSPLSLFAGTDANGTWQLLATDYGELDTGHINRFSIIVTPVACTPVARNVAMAGTKTVSGTYTPGSTVTYAVTLTNSGNGVQADNAGDEFVDVLPSQLTLVPGSTTATHGALSFTDNMVRWNGTLDAGASVVITELATINPGTMGLTVSSQGTLSFDANHNGVNDSNVLTDDPGTVGAANSTVFTVEGAPATLDIDGNGSYDALTDGLVIVRYLFGLTGTALTGDAIGLGAQRTIPAQVLAYLAGLGPKLDVDGNGSADALTDGLLILRYQFGLRGAALIDGAVAPGAPRNTSGAIEAFLHGVMP